MKLTESIKKDLNTEQIDSLMNSVGWTNHKGEEKWREILSKSSFVYSIYDGKKWSVLVES